jgi:hypothetical protein
MTIARPAGSLGSPGAGELLSDTNPKASPRPLGGLLDRMRVEVDTHVEISAKTVRELRKVTTWPENLAITTPQDR